MFDLKTAVSLLVTGAVSALTAIPVIVLPEKAVLQEKTAAQELALHLKLSTGKTVRIVSEKSAPARGKRIFVGKTALALKNKIDFKKFGEEEHFVKALDSDVLIIAGGFPRGTLYGVYEFLEDNLNVMWLDEYDIMIDKKKNIVWKKDLKLRGKPGFPYRSIWNSFPPNHTLYKIRNRQNTFHFRQPAKYDAYGLPHIFGFPHFCHTFYHYTKNLAKEDYDILSLSSGKRVYSTSTLGPGQICYSNPKTAKHFIKILEKKILEERKGRAKWQYPIHYHLSTNDNRNECECAGCQTLVKKHGWSGAKLSFVNKVAKHFEKKYPEITFATDAYGVHGLLPKGIKPGKNVAITIAFGSNNPERHREHFRPYSDPINVLSKKLHEDWAKLMPRPMIWDYWNDTVRGHYPSNPIPSIAENIKFYHSLKVQYLMGECGNARASSFWRLKNYLAYRMMVKPERNINAEIRRFCKAFYGAAAPQMLEYFKFLHKRTMSLKGNIEIYSINNRYDLDETFFKKTEALLAAADKATKNDKLRNERVRDELVPVQWAKIEKFKISDPRYVESFRKNALRRLKYESEYHRRGALSKLERFCTAALANVPPFKGFDKAAVITDYGWPQLSLARYNRLLKDPAAAGGQTAKAGSVKPVDQIVCGIYDVSLKNYPLRGAVMPLKAVPMDGKYHWYFLGRCRLTKDSLLFMHRTWTLQLPLAPSFGTADVCDNDTGIYISIKAEKNNYCIDRVVAVRGDTSRMCHLPAPLPQGIKESELVAELSLLSLHVPKVSHSRSAVRCAGKSGKLTAKGTIYTFFRDFTKVIKNKTRYLPVKKDGKYNLLSVYKGKFTRHCMLQVGALRLDLSGYFAVAQPDKEYEIIVSIFSDSQGASYVDRCFIMEAK